MRKSPIADTKYKFSFRLYGLERAIYSDRIGLRKKKFINLHNNTDMTTMSTLIKTDNTIRVDLSAIESLKLYHFVLP